MPINLRSPIAMVVVLACDVALLSLCQPASTMPSGRQAAASQRRTADFASLGTIQASTIGDPQIVYDYESQHCSRTDIPDLPAHAFRNAQGDVVLIASHIATYAAVGRTLDKVVHQCKVIYPSHNDPDFDHFRYHEWMASPYTLNGATVYALIHNEWYGYLANPQCARPPVTPLANDWVNAITLAISHDGGSSFSQPTDYIVRHPTAHWDSSFPCSRSQPTRYGEINGGNIFKKDGFYYNFYHSLPPPGSAERPGLCLMRTNDLSRPSSWEIWNGSGYAGSKTAPCGHIVVSGPRTNPSVTYNSYLRAYVMVWTLTQSNAFYFSTSKDLINWSPRTLIRGTEPNVQFASLLDPADTTRNFEVTGQTPYLYYTKRVGAFMDRNLMRVRIRFTPSGP